MNKSGIFPLYPSRNVIISRSDDCRIYDEDGKEYIDFESGVWCTNVGHGNKRVTEALIAQSNKVMHHGYNFVNKPAENLSLKLSEIKGLPGARSVFLSSGSEAVNLGISIAQQVTGRKKILKHSGSYISAYGAAKKDNDNENQINVDVHDSGVTENINFNEIACFVIETGGASYEMVKFPDEETLESVSKKAAEAGCLIIADEVTTGMGRTGKWFGFQYYDIKPDIVVCGKGLGNGYPVSSVTVSNKTAAAFEANSFIYAQSHQNDPLGCAIGVEVISEIEREGLLQRCNETGMYFKDRLIELKRKHPDNIEDVRGRGLMLSLQFSNKIDGDEVGKKLFDAGFVTGCKMNTLRFLPPLTITNDDIDKLINNISRIIKLW